MKKLKDILDGFYDKVENFYPNVFSLIIFFPLFISCCDLSSTPAYGLSLGLIYKEAFHYVVVITYK